MNHIDELLAELGDTPDDRIRREILRYCRSMVLSGDLGNHLLNWVEGHG